MNRLNGLPIALLATIRTGEGDRAAELLGSITTAELCTTLRPRPMSETATWELLAAALHVPADPAMATECRELTGGNPLLLNELFQLMRAARTPLSTAGLSLESFSEQIAANVARQPEPVLALANAIAVLGDDATAHTCAEVAGLDERASAGAHAALCELGVLRAGAWTYRHPVIRNAIMAAMSEQQRREVHAVAAKVLDAQGAAIDSVATQYVLAETAVSTETVSLLHTAAVRASKFGSPETAVQFLNRALTAPAAPNARSVLLTELSIVERTLAPSDAYRHLDEALALIESPMARARTVLNLVPLLTGSNAPHLIQILDASITDLSSAAKKADRELLTKLQAQLLYALSEDAASVHRAWEWVDRTAPEKLASVGPEAVLLTVYMFFSAFGIRQNARSCERIATRILGGDIRDDERTYPIMLGALGILSWTENDSLLDAVYASSLTTAKARHWPMVYSILRGARALMYYRRGQVESALEDAQTALQMHNNALSGEAMPMLVAAAANPLLDLGRVAEAQRLLEGPFPDGAQNSYRWAWVVDARSRVCAAQGQPRRALELTMEAGRELLGFGMVNPAALAWRERAVRLGTQLGEQQQARAIAEENLELARKWGTPGEIGSALGALADTETDHAVELLDEAAELLRDSPSALRRVRVLLQLAKVVPETQRARELLQEALELTSRCGATVPAQRVRAELVAAGGRPRRSRRTGVESLTPSERDIAALAAEGASNKEIAQSLFVTLRTVELHLTNCYRKLGIPGRGKLRESLGDIELQGA